MSCSSATLTVAAASSTLGVADSLATLTVATSTSTLLCIKVVEEGVFLAGSLDGVGTMVGTLELGKLLEGTLNGVGATTGQLSLVKSIAGSLGGVGGLVGNLTVTLTGLEGTLDGVGGMTGGLTLSKPILGQIDGVGTITASLDLTKFLSGQMDGVGTATAALSISKLMAGQLDGVGTMTGDISLGKALSGALNGVGTATGALSLIKPILGQLDGVGTAVGDLTVTGGGAAIDVINAQTVSGTTTSAGTHTISVDCTSADFLYVFAGQADSAANSVSGITYNGSALTFDDSAVFSADAGLEGWYIIAPDTGTNDLVVTYNAVTNVGETHAIPMSGVHQTVPVGTAATSVSSSGTASDTISSATGEIVLGAVFAQDGTVTEDGGQTLLEETLSSGLTQNSTEEAGATSVTNTWTLGGSNPWAVVMQTIKPV